MKQSLISKIVTSVLCFVFHSNYERSATRSTTQAKKVNNKKSHYKPFGYTIIREKCGKCFVECTKPNKVKTDKIIFHIHGGSFKAVLTDFYRKQAVFYSKLFGGAVVYSVDYRVYPNVKFPIPLEDVYNCYLKLIESENPDNVIVIGDSCGANMSAALCMKLRKNNNPLPNAIILFSFWGDLSNSGKSYRDNCYRDPFYGIPKKIPYEMAKDKIHRITLYARGEDLYNPYLSPCFGDFTSFPKTILVSGSADLAQSDSFSAYQKLKQAGVDVYHFDYENMFHDFQFVKFLPESKDVFKKIKSIFNV
ncbi:MAG: alpha/beta hydrolase fold domain-containing protein [Eubacterium sp.]|nr:alpha/beta hydrolase fold domain-containing protein [Eubacterium sp.]